MEITKKEKYLLGTLLILYLGIGLLHSNNQGFWHDEIYSLTFLKGISAYNFEGSTLSETNEVEVYELHERLGIDNFFSNLDRQIIHEGHPPLYFAFLKIWAVFFGDSALALRAFSLICGIGSMVFLFKLVREEFKRKYVSWGILLFCLFNPFLFYFFTEARMYALAFLIAILVTRYWMHCRDKGDKKSYFLFSVASIALLYTHYYGVFFLSTLFVLDIIKNGVSQRVYYYSIPFLFFLPWIAIIQKQTTVHDVHWTDGAFSLQNSLAEYVNGIVHLFSSPIEDPYMLEIIAVTAILLYALLFNNKSRKRSLYIILFSLLYFLQIFLFDQILDHHTIAVPRYYIFLLIFFFIAIADAFQNTSKKNVIVVTFMYCLVGVTSIIWIYNQDRAPKQMYKEVAAYIDYNHTSEERIIVVEPMGAMTWGLAYYLNDNFLIVAAEKYVPSDYSKSAIYVDEMLGVAFREDRLHKKEQEKMHLIPFVGLNLYE